MKSDQTSVARAHARFILPFPLLNEKWVLKQVFLRYHLDIKPYNLQSLQMRSNISFFPSREVNDYDEYLLIDLVSNLILARKIDSVSKRCWQAIADSHTPASGRNYIVLFLILFLSKFLFRKSVLIWFVFPISTILCDFGDFVCVICYKIRN